MATINAQSMTMLDVMQRLDPNGSHAMIVEMLQQENPLLEDGIWLEGNLPTGDRFTSRTALPSYVYRSFNEGVPNAKSRTAQVTETTAMLATKSAIDSDLLELNGNSAEYRAGEDAAFLQTLNNAVEDGMFNNSVETDPKKFQGLAPRLASTSGHAGSQIVKCTDSASGSDQTSIWLVGWGAQGVSFIYPKGSKVGLQAKDMGEQYVDDGTGNQFRAMVTDWSWKPGLRVKDYKRLARVANIDVGALDATGASETKIIESMVRAYHKVKLGGMRWAWYCNRTVGTYLHLQALHSVRNSTLTIDEVGGKPITRFLGIPIRETDGILDNEAAIS